MIDKLNKTKPRRLVKPILLISFAIFLVASLVFLSSIDGYLKQASAYGVGNLAQTTLIYSQDGSLLYRIHGAENRIVIGSTDIPDVMRQATLASEDHYFYTHPGIDIAGIARAFWNNIRKGRITQGGSTITQQVVKNAFFGNDRHRTYDQKLKEAVISMYIETRFSKDELLTLYLNQVPYGGNVYGVEAAAQRYFKKPAQKLTATEAATLAALPQSPSYYYPYGTHNAELLKRRNWILRQMEQLGYLNENQMSQAAAQPLALAPPIEPIIAPHFVMEVRKQLIKQYGQTMVEEGGLKVTTTLNLEYQKKAEEIVRTSREAVIRNGAENTGIVAIDPKTGGILAMVGSRDYFDEDIDGNVNVTTAIRQPGSAFKPIVYATLFKKQWGPGSTLFDLETNFGTDKNPYRPQNYDEQFRGPVSIRTALANSLNVPAVKALGLAGIDESLATAQQLGITTLTERDSYGLSLALGGGGIKLVELAGAYGAFANNGVAEPTAYWSNIKDKNGHIIYEHKLSKASSLDPAIAYEISHILSDNEARSTIFGSNSALQIPGYTVAAKTGTTEGYRDAWTIGYTPSLVVGVWVGNNNNRPMLRGSAGAMAAAPIWHKLMTTYLSGRPDEGFMRPSNIQTVELDHISGRKAGSWTRDKREDIFAPWQIQDAEPQMVKVRGCDGKVVTTAAIHSEKPDDPNWENPVIAWARSHGYTTNNVVLSCRYEPQAPTTTVVVHDEEQGVGEAPMPIEQSPPVREKQPQQEANNQIDGQNKPRSEAQRRIDEIMNRHRLRDSIIEPEQDINF